MKRLPILFLILALSLSVHAQFPLGSTASKIKAYFASNITYSSLQEYKTPSGNVLCFTKARVVGDYTFYFDLSGVCISYEVTYDKQDLNDVTYRFDNKFCKLCDTGWESEEGIYKVTLVPPQQGSNYFTVIYKPMPDPTTYRNNTLAAN